ncbi:hypothetical protein ELI13_37980 [Rhizobium ruizarguesonis]|uniref:hypothetical protein n=1 Tax=Rhizobium ruizarguesonis TaxID=2081791 RepID=UPI0010314F61|nr:hypothetical protein [Rhizobium ruizarguesonis]TAU59271.1 hypothetical protein ELI46_38505 [Rhizobium ruizarguesonis]TAU59323.1 hypothetical protein ELI46_38330 [Rhizobium ruizarguesonis]TAU60957.1 hypothetical protein ELI46_34825 [Rhizobium ruizarguesonis]TAW47958.1 hypothetical protein ELI15_37540 [Rhizobium ruizarguesonis]TAW80983.1 hypothetical protein ELI13_37980 [Rhizobium ruizarguesonis]
MSSCIRYLSRVALVAIPLLVPFYGAAASDLGDNFRRSGHDEGTRVERAIKGSQISNKMAFETAGMVAMVAAWPENSNDASLVDGSEIAQDNGEALNPALGNSGLQDSINRGTNPKPDGPTIENASPPINDCGMNCDSPAQTNPAMDLPEKPIEAPAPVAD